MEHDRPNSAIVQLALALDELTKTREAPLQDIGDQVALLRAEIVQGFEQGQTQVASVAQQVKNMESIKALLESISETNHTLSNQFYAERVIEPMARSLFPLIDFTTKAAGTLGEDVSRYQLAIQYLSAIITQLDQFLGNFGIERFQHSAEEPFDPKIMKPVKVVHADDNCLNGLIVESLLCGFRKRDRILRAETVSLFKCEDTPIEERN